MLRITDLAAVSQCAHDRGIAVVVDNTFASPYAQRPIEFGADLVLHSTTKFLNGHSDSVGGIVVSVRDDHTEWLKFVQNAEGAILGPMDAWLVLRGTKTLPIRMERHNANAERIAGFLADHPKVTRVHYPGLPDHPQHALAKRQMRGFGGLIAFALGSLEKTRTLLNSVRLMSLAESLGGVETLISHPATMTHASVPYDHRQEIGVTDDLVRDFGWHRGLRRPAGGPGPGARPRLAAPHGFHQESSSRWFFDTVYNVPELIRTVGFSGLIAIVFAETGLLIGFFLPGDSLLITAGLFAARGDFNIWLLVPVLIRGGHRRQRHRLRDRQAHRPGALQPARLVPVPARAPAHDARVLREARRQDHHHRAVHSHPADVRARSWPAWRRWATRSSPPTTWSAHFSGWRA